MDKNKRTFIPLALIILSYAIFILGTNIENIDSFTRIFIIVVCNIINLSAFIMIIRKSFKKHHN